MDTQYFRIVHHPLGTPTRQGGSGAFVTLGFRASKIALEWFRLSEWSKQATLLFRDSRTIQTRSRLAHSSSQARSVSHARSPEDGFMLGQRIVRPNLTITSARRALRTERLIASLEWSLWTR